MIEINREALRPAFEAAWPKAKGLLHAFRRNARGQYMNFLTETAFDGYCAAMESLLTDEAVERGARALTHEYDALPEAATYLQRKACTTPWPDRQDARLDARECIIAAITGKMKEEK